MRSNLVLKPDFGIVKFFNNDPHKKFGFIIPDQPGNRDIFFHRNSACPIRENSPGQLELEFELNEWIEREPNKGDRLVFNFADHAKGPNAFEWNYEDEWKKAEAIISARPWPTCLLCRVVRGVRYPNMTYGTEILWEGYDPFLSELILKGEVSFLKNDENWYKTIWVEEQKLQGWSRMWNPLDPWCLEFIKDFTISEEARRILEKFPAPRFLV